MEGNARPRFTARQKPDLWERWRSGECMADIARALERRSKSGVYRVLASNGVITPPARRRAAEVGALSRHVHRLPQEPRRSLPWDRGKEMADHKNVTIATDVQVYFCDPRIPWQRGSNENTNGPPRQYFPIGTDRSGYSQAYLNRIALRLNQRPRKTFAFETPADRLREVLHRPIELAAELGHVLPGQILIGRSNASALPRLRLDQRIERHAHGGESSANVAGMAAR